MTEDPIKLYVVVMTILLLVLGFVTYATWQQASAFEAAPSNWPVFQSTSPESAFNAMTIFLTGGFSAISWKDALDEIAELRHASWSGAEFAAARDAFLAGENIEEVFDLGENLVVVRLEELFGFERRRTGEQFV